MLFRRVVDIEFWSNKYNRPGEGRIMHILECRHQILTKKSYGNPLRMNCKECAKHKPTGQERNGE
jgi:hypothetical protein